MLRPARDAGTRPGGARRAADSQPARPRRRGDGHRTRAARTGARRPPPGGRPSPPRPIACHMISSTVIKVMIVDDHPLVRIGMATVVNQQPDMTIAAEADGGPRVIGLFRAHQPNVVLMDLRLRGDSGTRLTSAIRAEFPQARVLVISNYDGDEDIHQALAAGAMGYLFKSVVED